MTPLRSAAAPLEAVDGVEVLSDTTVVAHKRITGLDPYLEGHYPDATIYPGVFIVESVRQAVLRLLEQTRPDVVGVVLVRIASVRFTAPFLPGDQLLLRADCTEDGATLHVKARVTRSNLDGDDQPAAQVVLDLHLLPGDADAPGDL